MEDPLKKLIERRHPEYEGRSEHWAFVEATYDGGRQWFVDNIFRYIKEGDKEYGERVKRAYRFNHSKEVVDLVDKYLFKQAIIRRDTDAPEGVKRFWKSATQNGLDIHSYAKRISRLASIFGRCWVVVDNNVGAAGVTSRADEAAGDARIYSYVVLPQNVLDMGYAEDGALNWILIREIARDDADPMTSSGALLERFRLWTRNDWKLFERRKEGRKVIIELIDDGEHDLGEVPVFPADNVVSEELYTATGLIDDIAYLDRAVANYLSDLDAIIQDQTFSQLAMPAQGILPGEKGYDKLMEMGTSRIFTFDGEAKSPPFFLSPDVKQAELILKAIMKIVNEIYHSVGLSGERTKDDNGGGADNSSGVAKGYDFERTNSLLASKADSMEKIENRLSRLVSLWSGETLDDDLVQYPDDFDTRGLYDEFEIGARLTLLNAPAPVRREQMKSLIDKLFPHLTEAERDTLKKLDDWPPPELEPGLGQSGTGGAVAASGAKSVAKKMTAT